MRFSQDLTDLATDLISNCRKKGIKIATAESCTGGLIAACITSIPGSSEVFERGFNTYSNEAKHEILNVPLDTILVEGSVSKNVAIAMCQGALSNAPVELTVSVTGIAGPDGGTMSKPVGTVHMASARADMRTIHKRFIFEGDRNDVRIASVKNAIKMMITQI